MSDGTPRPDEITLADAPIGWPTEQRLSYVAGYNAAAAEIRRLRAELEAESAPTPPECPSCGGPASRVTKVAPLRWGDWPAVEVEHHVVRCSAECGDFYEPGEMDAATFRALQVILRDHAIPRTPDVPARPATTARIEEALRRVLDCAGTFEERVQPEQLAADEATLRTALEIASRLRAPASAEEAAVPVGQPSAESAPTPLGWVLVGHGIARKPWVATEIFPTEAEAIRAKEEGGWSERYSVEPVGAGGRAEPPERGPSGPEGSEGPGEQSEGEASPGGSLVERRAGAAGLKSTST